jgi:GGDEF domain-containing protein
MASTCHKKRGQAQQRATDLEILATIDFLTGVYNRRHFETLASVELARAHRPDDRLREAAE